MNEPENREDDRGQCEMELKRLTEHIWVMPYEEERDRPNLGYVKGDHWSLAIDAGHSAAHVGEFYALLEKENLPLPRLTVLTHWHWDHTFGMHAISGLSLANELTNKHLKEAAQKIKDEGEEAFLSLDETIRREYADSKPVIVTLSDMTFSGEMMIDAGNCPVKIFQAQSPHTDDSTLVFVPDDRVLIMGDCTGGQFPTWEVDQTLADRLADTIQKIDADICLPGHWTPLSKEYIIKDLREGE
jgi:glyoxylase-like metal-dependent hydrolase (beta-lactamase superfamily II)